MTKHLAIARQSLLMCLPMRALLWALLFFASAAQAQIAVRGVSSASTIIGSGNPTLTGNYQVQGVNGATSITIALPDFSSGNGSHNGDLLIAQITIAGSGAITPPAGWTLLNRTTSPSASSPITQSIYWKLHAGASETQNHTWRWPTSVEAAGAITLYTGVSMNNPFDAWTVGTTTGGTNFSLPTLTTVSNNTMLLAFLSSAQNSSAHAVPQNSNGTGKMGLNPGNQDYDQNVQNIKRVRITLAAMPTVAANTVVSKFANHSSTTADNVAHMIALRPASADAASPTLTIAKPAGTVDNDVMIASILFSPCSSTSGGACTSSITAPSGWAQVNTVNTATDGDGGADGYGSRLYVYRKVASSEPASYSWTFGGVTAPRKIDGAGGIMSFSGVDTTNPIVVQAGQANASSLTQATPAVTPTVANTMLVATMGIRSSGSFGASTGMTSQVNRATRVSPNAMGLTLGMYSAPYAATTSTGAKQAALSANADTGLGELLALRPAPNGPHHYEIQHGSGTGLTCTPSTITIKACADAASPCTPYTGGTTGTLGASGATANWSGGSGFTIPSGSSQVTKDVQVTTAGTADFSVASSTPAAANATTCNFGSPGCRFTSADSGFQLTVPDHVSENAATLTVKAVKKADNSLACAPGITGTKTVNFKCSYVNPTIGSLPVRIGGTALAGSVTSACTGTGANISLSFDSSGVAKPTLNYADVGKMRIDASYTGATGSLEQGLSMTGNTSFIAAPASFAFSGITSGPIRAGTSFSATVTAKNSLGATTKNFGKETSPEGVTLSAVLGSPAAGLNPPLKNNVILGTSFTSGTGGSASVTNLAWDEAGVITLKATLTSSGYLGSTVTAATGVSTTGTGTSSDLDRFIPDHFMTEVLGGLPCPNGVSCPGNIFSYSRQPFLVKVTALNLSGGVTTNYGGAIAKVATLSAFNAPGSSTANPNCGTFLETASPAKAFSLSSFTAGAGSLAIPFYALPDTCASTGGRAPGPTDIYVRAIDADGVSSLRTAPAVSVEGGIQVIRGRILLDNAYGSEQSRLPVNFLVQYWNGSGWIRSLTDSATTFAPTATNTQFSNCGGNLALPSTTNCRPVLQADATQITASSGMGRFMMMPPGIGNIGVANLQLNVPAWLPSTTGQLRYGMERNRVIYMRENY